jgi:TPR repeat protein
MTGVLVVALLSASSAFAGASEDCAAAYDPYDPQNSTEALRLCQPLADQGNVDAQAILGFMYELGNGVTQNFAEAAKWYRKAAEQGQVAAQVRLGSMYLQGRGVPQDYAEAVK